MEVAKYSVWKSFDSQGWTRCPSGYYMTGLWRNNCQDDLGCIEYFRCCKMKAESPEFCVQVEDLKKGYTEKCCMNVAGVHTCNKVSEKPLMRLKTTKFTVEDQSELSVAQPRPLQNFKPKICMPSNVEYTCLMRRAVSTTKESSLTIGTGFSMAYSYTSSFSVGFEQFGVTAGAEFSTTISAEASFNAGWSKGESKTVTDILQVSVDVPLNEKVTIDVKRVTQDLVYFWKGHFDLLGTYTVNFGDKEITQDVTRVLSGTDRKFYSFGKWEYPGTDFHKIIITNQYGNQEEQNCEQIQNKDLSCTANF